MALVITTLHSLAVAVSPSRSLLGVDSQRVLSTLRYGVVTTSDPDPEALLSGRAAAELGREEVTVSLAFGQLTRGDAAGTRVLIKEYRADQTPQTPTEIARAQLEGSLGGAPPGGLDQLEALFASDGRSAASIAAAMAENEFAAHLRLQPPGGSDEAYGYRGKLSKLLGQESPEPGTIRMVFPWYGEVTRMALPTRTPPTLATWLDLHARGETLSAKVEANIPGRTCQLRGEYARGALSTALLGLTRLHEAALTHGSLGASAVLVSSEDDRKGASGGKGRLLDLAFARDLRSLEPASRVGGDGALLPLLADRPDPLATDLRERAARAGAAEEGAFGTADDMRAFGVLLLQAMVEPNAERGAFPLARLLQLIDGPFAASSRASADGAVDVDGLRDYLAADEACRRGGYGGVELLDSAGGAGWSLVASLLGPYAERPSAAAALGHPFWSAGLLR